MRPRGEWAGLGLAGLLVACGDPMAPPVEGPAHTLLVHRQTTTENILISTDGELTNGVAFAGDLLPLGAGSGERVVAACPALIPPPPVPSCAPGSALVLLSLNVPGRVDTVIDPMPASHSLVSFSNDERLLALVSYAPPAAVLVYDRANHSVDTLRYSGADPDLPPVFSPDNQRVALLSVTDLSMFVTVLHRDDPSRSQTDPLRIARLINRPIFGWPRWTEEGLILGFVRVAGQGPDTLVAGRTNPDAPNEFLEELYRAVMAPVSDSRPPVRMGLSSTYAFSADGQSIVLAADPGTGGHRHAVYLITPETARIRLLLDDPAQFPVFPLFVD